MWVPYVVGTCAVCLEDNLECTLTVCYESGRYIKSCHECIDEVVILARLYTETIKHKMSSTPDSVARAEARYDQLLVRLKRQPKEKQNVPTQAVKVDRDHVLDFLINKATEEKTRADGLEKERDSLLETIAKLNHRVIELERQLEGRQVTLSSDQNEKLGFLGFAG